MDYLSAAQKKMAQAVGEHKLLGGWCDPQWGLHLGLPRWKQNGFWGRMGAYCFFTADSASPALWSIWAFKPFTSKGNWKNRLTSFIPRCWQIPKTDFVTQRLCLQWNDLGIEGLSNMGPQPNTSRSTKYLMIPDSRNQSPGAEILFLFLFFIFFNF